ncbi:BZ3500_MvSof-1268-A1-R1_Chr6-3g08766 [Microbotryum saponariae]|uniref:BZ3500_MvSof-1268-A1-R1_Chr6-3g08766 protein n=1 Tax=Microbotryum saponariae TaxID=289078 RepID=A0A2X0LCH9_9BASI|nr:BZ3500_MvSof-1268-A1-R1_Chr6-3g08766 [Microbotryum saponariae]
MNDEVEVEEGDGEGEEEEAEEGVGDDEDDEGEGSDEGKDGNEVEADEGSADASSRASPEPEPTVAKLRGPASKRAPQAKKASTTTTKAASRPTRGSTRAETEDETKKGPLARPVKPVKQTYVNRKRPTRRAGAEFDDEGDDMDELALQGDETDYDEDAVLKEVRREEPESEADSGTESGSESESDEEPELATPPSAKVLKELNDDLKSQRFPSLLLSSGIKLKIGDPIELTSGEKEPWLGKVVQIRTLKSGLTNVLNEKGDPLKNSRGKPALQSKESYVQIHWLYTKKMFESDVQDKSRITKTINSLGDYERVETSHADWYSQSKIKSIDEAVVVYRFDDTFPAQNPDHPDQQTDHALTQFRKPKLDDNLPLFFFGDEGPGSDQTPYVRTDFDFDPDVGEVEEEEEVAVEPAQKGKGRKRKASTSASASKANKKARLPRGPPLTLKLHSITCKPYNPRNVQIFSTEGYGGWYDVDDLIAYGKVAPLSRSVGLARLDQEVFSDDDNDDDENEDEDQAEGSHGRTPPPNKKGREVVREMKPFKLPSLPTPEKPKRGAKPAIDQDAAMLKWILGRGPMMRGGAYGLIGNSVILHRAQALVDRFEKIPLNGPKLWQQDAHKVIVAFDEWDRCVQIRSKVKGKPWARLGLPPQGMCWTSPVSETHLV